MRFMFLLVVIVMVTACTGPNLPPLVSPSCERVQGLPLSNQIGQQVDLTEFQAWIVSNYGVGANDISIERWMSDYSLQWKASTVEYSVEVMGNIVTRVIINFNSSLYGPDIKKMIECLGEPQFYSATYGRRVESFQLSVYLFWQDQGIIASGGKSYFFPPRQASLRLDSSSRLNLLNRVQPGTLAEAFPYNKPAHAWPKDGGPLVIDFE